MPCSVQAKFNRFGLSASELRPADVARGFRVHGRVDTVEASLADWDTYYQIDQLS
jgi:hypothetical protein